MIKSHVDCGDDDVHNFVPLSEIPSNSRLSESTEIALDKEIYCVQISLIRGNLPCVTLIESEHAIGARDYLTPCSAAVRFGAGKRCRTQDASEPQRRTWNRREAEARSQAETETEAESEDVPEPINISVAKQRPEILLLGND